MRAFRQLPVRSESIDAAGITTPIPLSEAAERLNIDVKTLRKRLQDLDMIPEPDPKDKRVRLLTPEQFETVRRALIQTRARIPEYATRSLFTEELVAQAEEVLEDKQRYLERWEARLTERERQLHEMMMAILRRLDKFNADHESKLELLRQSEVAKEPANKN